MAVTKEFECAAHGVFESTSPEPKCPMGCKGTAKRVIVTAPGVKSLRTRNLDELDKEVAGQLGVSNWSNRKGTVASSTDLRRMTAEQVKNKQELDAYERKYVSEKGGMGAPLKFNPGTGVLAGKEIPRGPTPIALPEAGRDSSGRPLFNRAMLPGAMPGTAGNNIAKLPPPRAYTRTMNRPDDPTGHKGLT